VAEDYGGGDKMSEIDQEKEKRIAGRKLLQKMLEHAIANPSLSLEEVVKQVSPNEDLFIAVIK
jgi:hypothetical protein